MLDWLNNNTSAVMAAAAVVNVLVVGVLALITWRYAESTHRIEEATKEQAKASRQMAEEMERQRMVGMQPIVTLDAYFDPGSSASGPGAILSVHNDGHGPAFNLEVFVVDVGVSKEALREAVSKPEFPYGERYPRFTKSTLLVDRASGASYKPEGVNLPRLLGQGKTATYEVGWNDLPRHNQDCLFAVEYGDVYGRHFRSGLIWRFTEEGKRPLEVVNAEVIPPALIRDSVGG